jgi:predicted Zn-dependent peptidase
MRFSPALLLVLAFSARLAAAAPDPIRELERRVVERTLPNGLKVIVLRRSVAPLVSFNLMFRAGGVDESEGKTGLAHLFEHMMFKGTRTVGTRDYAREKPILDEIDRLERRAMAEERKGARADAAAVAELRKRIEALEAKAAEITIPSELDQIYQRAGGEGLNAFTTQDMTGFVVSLPSNKWTLWPMLESDRMANPVLREFYKERNVVMEERLMRYENSPHGKLWENFAASAFQAHSYRSPTIGWMSDLKNLALSDAADFFRTHYAPNNAAVAIVGDVDPEEVFRTLEKEFASVPAQTLPEPSATQEPEQAGEKRIVVEFDAEPTLMMGFHKPAHPNHFCLRITWIYQWTQ